METALPGVRGVQLGARQIWDLLTADAGYLVEARTVAQHVALEGRDHNRDGGGAVWTQADEGRAADRAEKQEALARYRAMWGTDPV